MLSAALASSTPDNVRKTISSRSRVSLNCPFSGLVAWWSLVQRYGHIARVDNARAVELVDAVNVLLTNIGEQPVDTLNNQQAQEVRMAERTLREFQKDGQARA